MRGKFGVEPIFYSYARDEADSHANLIHLLRSLSPAPLPLKSTPARTPDREKQINPEDPNKGQWGGAASANGRRIRVVRRRGGRSRETLAFDLVVERISDESLDGDVTFHMHPTFAEPVYVVRAAGGRAVLEECLAYGAFTVGVSADDGRTKLELDLAAEEKLPEWFRRR